jgi:hypothetical protein
MRTIFIAYLSTVAHPQTTAHDPRDHHATRPRRLHSLHPILPRRKRGGLAQRLDKRVLIGDAFSAMPKAVP